MYQNFKYRDRLKGLYVVARNFFLLLLNCSAWLAWVLLSKTFKNIDVRRRPAANSNRVLS